MLKRVYICADMFKNSLLAVICIFAGLAVRAQSADSVYNQYADFNLARFQGQNDQARAIGENILPHADKLPEKVRINFYFGLGKLYDDDNEPDKALPFYEKVVVADPDYYVVHRALGYIYLAKANAMYDKLNAAGNMGTDTLKAAFTNMARKALPNLEKAQACDPDDDTLAIIKALYGKMQDSAGLATLGDRLKQLSAHCQDILSEN